jgi:hypothetical protein
VRPYLKNNNSKRAGGEAQVVKHLPSKYEFNQKYHQKKNKGYEPNRAIIYINMECHKEIPCVAILNKQKCHFFLLQNWRTEKLDLLKLPGKRGREDKGW